MMIWNSLGDFFHMGGYGLYVWGSVAVTFGLMFGEILLLAIRWNESHRQLGKWLHHQQKQQRDDHENEA